MRSECQFFMSREDEAAFVAHATTAHSLVVNGDGVVAVLECSLGSIQLLRSVRFGDTLTAGRIALATTGLDGENPVQESASELERIYRQLCRWMKKHYTNDLVAYSESLPPDQRKIIRYPNFWLGPHARSWLLSHTGAALRQFLTGAVVFTLRSSDPTGVA